jgi:hypothetical protein
MELREPFGLGDRGIFCTVSIGIAPCGEAYRSAADMVRDADTAMYTAKSKGRSRCEVFDETMRTRVVERLQLENDLRRAVWRTTSCPSTTSLRSGSPTAAFAASKPWRAGATRSAVGFRPPSSSRWRRRPA